MRKTICLVAGARPNFMKIAPIVRALKADGSLPFKIIHTGQHYDREMNDVFFEELAIPRPDLFIGAGSGSHAVQTGKIMVGFEEFCQAERPDIVLVVGDVNSTLACSVVAKKEKLKVAHVEAGLRSGDMTMPEEINRIVTDSISDLFFVTEPSGLANLRHEGKPDSQMHYVGHVMIDNLFYQRDKLTVADVSSYLSPAIKAKHAQYGVITLHRPSTVDEPEVFTRVARALRTVSSRLPLVFPVHPRTKENLDKFGIDLGSSIRIVQPLPYMDFLNLWKDATLVLTDSGGVQEETTALGVPCITLRDSTERPVTVDEGTNTVVGTDPQRITEAAFRVLNGEVKTGRCPHLWDGHAAERIVEVLRRETR